MHRWSRLKLVALASACCLLVLGLSSRAAFGTPADPSALDRLAASQAWLKLLHYERQRGADHVSRVSEPGFFVAPAGRTDPAAELRAFVGALKDPARTVGVFLQPAACAFPARARLVREQLNVVPAVSVCPDFERWRDQLAAKGATLVFASSYANNPASLFGHTLLRLNSYPASVDSTLGARELLNYTVSFLAQTDPTDDAATYALKGMFGGYVGTYNLDPYYMSVAIYKDAEDRDLWEYDLDLAPAVMTRLVEHLWEVQNNARIPYYFPTENCAFHLLALLEAADPALALTERTSLFVLPLDTVRQVIAAGLNIKRVKQRPALSTSMQAAVAALPPDVQDTFWQLIRQDDAVWSKTLAIPELDAAIAYWNYRKFAQENQLDERDTLWLRRLFERRASLGAARDDGLLGRTTTIAGDDPTRPDHGHLTSAVSLFGGRQRDRRFGGVMLRAGMHDLLGDARGYDSAAAITYGEVAVTAGNSDGEKTDVRLERLKLADVMSLDPYTALVPRWSWRLKAGLDRLYDADERQGDEAPLALRGEAGAGVSVAPVAAVLAYALGVYAHDVADELRDGYRAAPGADAGMLLTLSSYRTMIYASWRRDLGPFGTVRREVHWRQSLTVSDGVELQLDAGVFPDGDERALHTQAGVVTYF